MTYRENGLLSIPENWKWSRLSDCVDILDHKRIPVNSTDREHRIANKPKNVLYPYYGATGQAGWIDDYIFDEELVLLGEDGAPFLEPYKDKSYIIKGKSWVNNHAHVLRAIFGITTNGFLCNYLNFFDYHGYVTGTTRAKLNQSPMRNIPVPLPPLPEQHRIATKLEELFTRLDAGVEALKKIKTQLKQYRQAVLKFAFEGKLTEEWREAHKHELEPAYLLVERIKQERRSKTNGKLKELSPLDTSDLLELPEGWVWERLGNMSEIILGQSPPSSTYNEIGEGLPFYQGKLEFGNIYPTPRKWCTSPNKIAEKGDILISVRAPVGPTNICPDKSCIGRGLAAIRPLGGMISYFILYCLRSFENLLASEGTGTTFSAITGDQLKGFIVPIPPFTEQEFIVEEIQRDLSVADEMEKTIDRSLQQSERLRQSILKRAFEGKLVPQDPNDEPAEKLLERIKAEKAAQEVERKPRKRNKRTAGKIQGRLI